MSDVSLIDIDAGFLLVPESARGRDYQSRGNFPEHETEQRCIDGRIAGSGIFIRSDGLWNPQLEGWVRLDETSGQNCWLIRFERGAAVEVLDGNDSVNDQKIDLTTVRSVAADGSPNDWRPTEHN